MRRPLILIAILITFSSLFAQNTYKVEKDEKTGKPMLVGLCTREVFADTNYSSWFSSGYQMYKPDSTIINELKSYLDNINITLVLGTWCSDSHDQVPNFFKIIDQTNFPEDRLTMICVDRNRKGISNEVDSLNIKLVPTFIFYKEGKELGRIEETPSDTIEKDMLAIITKNK